MKLLHYVLAHFRGVVLIHEKESRLPAAAAVLFTILVSLTLSTTVTVGPQWLLPALAGVLMVSLIVAAPHRHGSEPGWQRTGSILITALLNVFNVVSLVLLIQGLLHGTKSDGPALLIDSFKIWTTNVVIFGLWYWELDRGGPRARMDGIADDDVPDFLFPQMQMRTPSGKSVAWSARFVDYLYLSFTNATAFSPTDTMPLSQWAKLLMSVQAMASLVTVALVAARAVNILQ